MTTIIRLRPTVLLLVVLALFAFPWAVGRSRAQAQAPCSRLAPSAAADAALAQCLAALPSGGTLALSPGAYHLNSPLTVTRPVTITTRGLSPGDPGCAQGADLRCATLALGPMADRLPAHRMPIEIAAPGVTLSHLRIVGTGAAASAYGRRICAGDHRPAGGGVRVAATNFTFLGSVVRNVACYTAMEVVQGSDGLTVRHSVFGPNGNHDPGEIWSDGLTVHDVRHATIDGNLFYDNTDVQLILGGCQGCSIRGNQFRHSGAFRGASFADLMLQSWKTTSGDFTGSTVSGNAIDCSAARRCGYGIMIGSNPWYVGRAAGGNVVGNVVHHAEIGLNIDELTGPMMVSGNRIDTSGGIFSSACGVKRWPAINVSVASRPFLRGDAGAGQTQAVATRGCLLNRNPS